MNEPDQAERTPSVSAEITIAVAGAGAPPVKEHDEHGN